MRNVRLRKRLAGSCALLAIAIGHSGEALAQEQVEQAPADTVALPHSREASGTSWLPDDTPMFAVHGNRGGWEWMGHGNLFVQYLRDAKPRGFDQGGSINWFMGMAKRTVGPGRVGVKAMMSLEPLTIGGCGYPDLLASGERCDGAPIVDQQHPHDLFMELAATWEAPSARGMGLQLYGGPVGEPALGPVAFPHRVSAIANPLAPISHHWLDATHITHGVMTVGLHGRRWKAEGSVFNGREPDEDRYDIDLAPLDSYSGRIWFLPTPSLALQVSAGRLEEAEFGETSDVPHGGDPGHEEELLNPDGPRVDVARFTASVTYHRLLSGGPGVWASTLAWGRNRELGESTDFVLAETTVSFTQGHVWFGRVDAGVKDAHDMNVDGVEGAFSVAKLQAGYTRYFGLTPGFEAGLGATATVSLLHDEWRDAYGGRSAAGVGVFLVFRPRGMMMSAADPHAGHH